MNDFIILLVSVRCIRTSQILLSQTSIPFFVTYQQHICMETGKNLETKPLQVKGIVAVATIFQNSTFKPNYMSVACL